MIEKHLTLSRAVKGPDSEFSLEPNEFKAMVDAVRTAELAIGKPEFRVGEKEKATRAFRRSLFVVEDVKAGDLFMILRVAITGSTATPPLFETMVVLGRDHVLARLERAHSLLSQTPVR